MTLLILIKALVEIEFEFFFELYKLRSYGIFPTLSQRSLLVNLLLLIVNFRINIGMYIYIPLKWRQVRIEIISKAGKMNHNTEKIIGQAICQRFSENFRNTDI